MVEIISHVGKTRIIGDKEGLNALGNALLMKANIGENLSLTFTGSSSPIHIGIVEEIKAIKVSNLLSLYKNKDYQNYSTGVVVFYEDNSVFDDFNLGVVCGMYQFEKFCIFSKSKNSIELELVHYFTDLEGDSILGNYMLACKRFASACKRLIWHRKSLLNCTKC